MINRFLNNVNKGENDWWRYLITIVSSLGVSAFMAAFFSLFLIAIYFLFIGNSDIFAMFDYMDTYDSNIALFFIITFIEISFAMIFLFLSLKFIHKRDFMSIVNFSPKYDEFSGKAINWVKRVRWGQMLKGALIWLIFMITTLLTSFLLSPESYSINPNMENIYLIIFLFILAIPIQVLFEELVFRGYLNQGLSLKIKSPIVVILISSLIFSLLHIFNGGFNPIFMIANVFYTFILGIIFSVATLTTNGVEWATGAHFTNNLLAFLIISSEGSLGNFETIIHFTDFTDPLLGLLDFLIVALILLILLIILFFHNKEKILNGLGIE